VCGGRLQFTTNEETAPQATPSTPTSARAFFVNETGSGYTPADGFGLVNADAALRALGH